MSAPFPAAMGPAVDATVAARLADGLLLQPEAVRAVATRAALVAEALPWHSPAATAFRERVSGTACALRAAADRLDDAVGLLQRYALARTLAAGR